MFHWSAKWTGVPERGGERAGSQGWGGEIVTLAAGATAGQVFLQAEKRIAQLMNRGVF